MLLLAIDVGNTQISLGVFRDSTLAATWRAATEHDRTEDELAVFLDGFLSRDDISLRTVDAVVIGSVVPPLTTELQRLGTNFDCVSADGDFVGGSFAPGLELASEALFARAARLFRVPLTAPKEAIGKNTAACLQSGLVFGYVGLVEGLVTRLRQELPGAKTIATGGLASTMAPLTKSLDTLDDALTLQGLRLLWELNR